MKDFDTFTKVAYECRRFGQGFKKLPKVQKITKSGHTGPKLHFEDFVLRMAFARTFRENYIS